MTARTHDAFAFASLVTVSAYYPPTSLSLGTLFAAVVGNIIGSLIPDMDQASNRLWDLLPAGDYIGKVFRRLFLSHRTLSHSFLGLFIIYNILGWLLPKFLNPLYIDANIVFASVMIGYVSHLLADSLTKEGLPLLFPFKIYFGVPPLKTLRITTGSWVERFLVLPAVGAYLIWFISVNQDKIISVIRSVGS
jgi:inner membrane protein